MLFLPFASSFPTPFCVPLILSLAFPPKMLLFPSSPPFLVPPILLSLFFSLFPSFAFPPQNSLSCDGFGWSQWEGNCYKMFAFDLNFAQAEDLCTEFASNLASILSEKENELVKGIVRDEFMAKKCRELAEKGRELAFWMIDMQGEGQGENGTDWTNRGALPFEQPAGAGQQPTPWTSDGKNGSTANEMNPMGCAGMEPKEGLWLHLPCNLSLIGAVCKRKAVANLDEGIPYGILLNQTVTGKGRLNITEEKKRQMLRREQNLVEMINDSNNKSDGKGWQAKVHETFAVMSDSSKGHMLGIMQPRDEKGRSSREKRQYQYPSDSQQQHFVGNPNKLYQQYADASQFGYARPFYMPHQQYAQAEHLNPAHMQRLYKEAYAQYDRRELASALRGYLQYIALAYAQPQSVFPRHYDLRDKFPQCAPWVGLVRDQGKCGACWAVATAAARDDRACIFLTLRNFLVFNNNPNLYSSSMDLISCTKEADGCNGGTPKLAWQYLEKYGYLTGAPVVNGSGCKPYVFPPLKTDPEKERKAPECTEHCQAGWKRMAMDKLSGRMLPPSNETRYRTVIKTNHWGMDHFEGQLHCKNRSMNECYRAMLEGSERGIMAEIYYFGSVVVSIDVYEDFFRYSKGIYRHTWGDLKGGHAVKLIGWGEEGGQKYWLGVNSWNAWWGERGLFKIGRGQNESGIEWRAIDVGYIFF